MFYLKLKLAVRAIMKGGIFTYANILGMGISLGAILTIFIYTHSELGVDSQLSKGENIYRVIREVQGANATYRTPNLAAPFLELLSYEMNIPQKDIVRMYREDELVRYKEAVFFESNVLYVDSNFFQLMDLPLQKGRAEDALREINAAVISDQIAQKYFGDRNPIGEILEIEGKGLWEVRGVLDKPRSKSHLEIDFLVNNRSLGYAERLLNEPDNHAMTFYLHIPREDYGFVAENLEPFSQKHLSKEGEAASRSLSLQALPNIYFDQPMYDDIARHGNYSLIQVLIAIAIILALLIGANFINLTLAKLTKLVKQIGIKKVLGSSKKGLIFDWSLEVYLSVLFATLLGAVGCNFILPILAHSYDLSPVIPDFLSFLLWGMCFTVLLASLIVAIPGWLFSSIDSFAALSNKVGKVKIHVIQYILLLVQFTVAFVLIVFTVVINSQYQFMQRKETGMNEDQVLVFHSNNKHSWKNRAYIRNEIQQLSGVKDVSMAYGGLPTGPTETLPIQVGTETYQWHNAFIEPNFIDLLDLRVVEGKAFDGMIESETASSILLNVTAASTLGWPQKNLIGTSVKIDNDSSDKRILGIIQDYHYESLKNKIQPLILQSTDWEEAFIVKLDREGYQSLLTKMESIWQQYVPNYPFTYTFLDETFQRMHIEETRNGKIIFLFTFLTILIASIGTLSLGSFILQAKAKEIAIRKILGAPILKVLYAQSSSLLKVLFLSGLVALPLAGSLVNAWLEDFGYRIALSPRIFLLSYGGLIGGVILLLIIQSWKQATGNPIENLKAE